MTGKIHRATVTGADLNYVGSITVDSRLLNLAGILGGQKVQVVNNNNGARFSTYAISAPEGCGVICLNGAAARLVQPGDQVIILAYGLLDDEECRKYKPHIVFVDGKNRPLEENRKE